MGSDLDIPLLEAVAALDIYEGSPVLFRGQRLQGNQRLVFFPLQHHVGGGGHVRQQARMLTFNFNNDRNSPDIVALEEGRSCHRTHAVDLALEGKLGEGIESNRGRLSHPEFAGGRLVSHTIHLHAGQVHNLHEGAAGVHRIAHFILCLGAARTLQALQDHHAVHRGDERE